MKERVLAAVFASAMCALLVAASLTWSAAQPLCNKTTKDYRIFFECNGCGYVNLLVEDGLCHTLTVGHCCDQCRQFWDEFECGCGVTVEYTFAVLSNCFCCA